MARQSPGFTPQTPAIRRNRPARRALAKIHRRLGLMATNLAPLLAGENPAAQTITPALNKTAPGPQAGFDPPCTLPENKQP